jgi:hypothetical protein
VIATAETLACADCDLVGSGVTYVQSARRPLCGNCFDQHAREVQANGSLVNTGSEDGAPNGAPPIFSDKFNNNEENQELGTRKPGELGTRTTSPLNAFLVPSSQSEPGSSPRVPGSLQQRIVDDIRRLHDERVQQAKPEPVPYALSWVVTRCGARDKPQAKRAIDALLEAGVLEIAYTLTRTRTRCYVLVGERS